MFSVKIESLNLTISQIKLKQRTINIDILAEEDIDRHEAEVGAKLDGEELQRLSWQVVHEADDAFETNKMEQQGFFRMSFCGSTKEMPYIPFMMQNVIRHWKLLIFGRCHGMAR